MACLNTIAANVPEVSVIHSLNAVASGGHQVPGSGPGTFFHVFRLLGDPSVICMIPPVGLGMAPVIYPLKANFPSFSPLSRRLDDTLDFSEVQSDEMMPVMHSAEEVIYERRNKPVYARFRR
jgi:hypothetical protein